jgi:hypothetical protein
LLGSLVANESLAENFQRHGSVDEQVRRPIDGTHPTTAEPFVEPVLPIEHTTQKWIERNISNRGVGLQGSVVAGTDKHIVRKLPATSWALKHR